MKYTCDKKAVKRNIYIGSTFLLLLMLLFLIVNSVFLHSKYILYAIFFPIAGCLSIMPSLRTMQLTLQYYDDYFEIHNDTAFAYVKVGWKEINSINLSISKALVIKTITHKKVYIRPYLTDWKQAYRVLIEFAIKNNPKIGISPKDLESIEALTRA